MKKVKVTFGIFLMTASLLTSCGGSAESIKVEELNDACSIMSAMEVVVDEMTDFKDKYKDMTEEPSEDLMAQAKNLESKMKDLGKRAEELDLELSDLEKCDDAEKIMTKIKDLNLRF